MHRRHPHHGSRGPRPARPAARRPAPGRGLGALRSAADGTADVLHPVVVIVRGLVRLCAAGRRWWRRTPQEHRSSVLFLACVLLAALWLLPYGPLAGTLALAAAAAWQGRERGPRVGGPDGAERARLRTLYEALVPHLRPAEGGRPDPLYVHGGDWRRAFTEAAFADGGLARLRLRYPPGFPDGEAAERARLQRLLGAKAGRGREYRFLWDEERSELEVSALPPLPTGIRAQHYVAAPGETVLGFTDPLTVRRTIPVAAEGGEQDVPPVVWRTGPRSAEPHLLVLGRPGAGATTLLRSIALQALRRDRHGRRGEVLVVDGGGSGGFACLAGRDGVPAVESTPAGALAALEWAARETERRLLAAASAQQASADACRPLWVLVDRPAVLGHLARVEDRGDLQELLQVPLRHGRAVRVAVVLAEQLECADRLAGAVGAYARARVVLGAVPAEQVRAVLGETPPVTPPAEVPPGRGYARLGAGPVHRLQVPAVPDPYDEEADEAQRRAVLALLPEPAARPAEAPAAPAG